MAAAIAHGSSPGPASSWPSNTAAPGPTHRKPMARRSDLSRPPCANGPTRNTGLTPIKETCTYNHGTITTTGKDPMVASITARPSAAPRSEQPLDHLQVPPSPVFITFCNRFIPCYLLGQVCNRFIPLRSTCNRLLRLELQGVKQARSRNRFIPLRGACNRLL